MQHCKSIFFVTFAKKIKIMNFSERVEFILDKKNMTKTELAKNCNESLANIMMILNRNAPSWKNLFKIIEGLEVTEKEFFDLDTVFTKKNRN